MRRNEDCRLDEAGPGARLAAMASPQQSRKEPGPPGLPHPSPAAAARLLAWVLPLVLAATIAHHSLSDLDIWLHHRAGSDILAGEGVLDRNTYSFTAPEYPWVDHEWLFQVLVAALARLRGGVGSAPELLSGPWHVLRVSLAVLLMWLLLRDRAVGRRRPRNNSWPWPKSNCVQRSSRCCCAWRLRGEARESLPKV